MLASGRSRNGRRGQHTRAATPYCTPGKSLGLVGELVGEKGGSTHNPKDDKDVRLGLPQARTPWVARLGQDALCKPGKSMGLSMGELKRGSTHNHKDYLDARLGALQARTPWVARLGQDALCALGKSLGQVGEKRGKPPHPKGRQGCTSWGTSGTSAAVSMPRPLRPTARQENLGAGREKGEAPNPKGDKDARLGALQTRAPR